MAFRPTGPRERLNSYIDLIRFTVWAGVLPERVGAYLLQTVGSKSQKWTLDCVKDMRESVADLVYAGMNPNSPTTRDLDSFLRNAVSEVYWIPLSSTATRRHWAWKPGMERGAELPLSLLAGRILNFTNHADPRKVRYCLNPACRKIFLDFSKVGRHWCDMNRCGSAQKRKAFEAKKRLSVVRQSDTRNAAPRPILRQGELMDNPKPIDAKQIEELISLGASEDEIADLMGISETEFRQRFRRLAAKAKVHRSISLRRAQLQSAMDGDARSLIFLGKQYLGQSNNPKNSAEDSGSLESFIDFIMRGRAASEE